MSAASRQQAVARLHKALRTQYRHVPTDTSRPLLEQVLFACCLENAPYELAQKAFARLGEAFFDLNEVRVTTVAELAEVLHDLPDPPRAALALRRVLQSVFESSYSFSLESARKHSLAHGVKTLESLQGIPPFVVAHVASTALGGHFVPVDLGGLQALYLAGIVTRDEYDAGRAAGLERLVAKKNGPEFSSLLHQFGVEVLGNLHGTTVRRILQSVAPDLKERFPKRGEPMPLPSAPAAADADGAKGDGTRGMSDEHRPAGPQAAARPAGKTPLPPPGSGPKRTADGKPVAGSKPGPKPFVVKPNVGRPPPADLPPAPPAAAEPEVVEPAKPVATGKAASTKAPAAGKGGAGAAKGAAEPAAGVSRPARPAADRGAKKPAVESPAGTVKERGGAAPKPPAKPPRPAGRTDKGGTRAGSAKGTPRKAEGKGAGTAAAQLTRRKPR